MPRARGEAARLSSLSARRKAAPKVDSGLLSSDWKMELMSVTVGKLRNIACATFDDARPEGEGAGESNAGERLLKSSSPKGDGGDADSGVSASGRGASSEKNMEGTGVGARVPKSMPEAKRTLACSSLPFSVRRREWGWFLCFGHARGASGCSG